MTPKHKSSDVGHGWVPLLSAWNYHNIVNQVYSNIKLKIKKNKSSDAGNLDMPKRNCKMLPLIEKVKVFNMEIKPYCMPRSLRSNLLFMKEPGRLESVRSQGLDTT